MIRLLVADDQHLVRGALEALLAMEDDFEIVASVADGAAAVRSAVDLGPDVALLDIEMPIMDGITATRQIRTEAPGVRVMILTTFGRPGYLRRAMDAGARGFMVKDAPPTSSRTRSGRCTAAAPWSIRRSRSHRCPAARTR